jgi:hypothetical protein
MKLSSLQKLDKILEILKKNKEHRVRMKEIIHSNKEITYDNFDMIINKLMKDGYVDRPYDFSNPLSDTFYSLTFEGLVFHDKGGYIEQERQLKISTCNKRIQNILLTYGTTFAGVYGIFEILKWFFHHEGWHLPF